MQIIGHRGASGYKPENTLASFQAAIALGVDMIELDVCSLPSGQVVVLHDATVNRTTNGHGPVTDFSYDDLQRLDAGNGQHIPLLVEVLDLMHKRLPINIELKGPRAVVPLVASIIDHYVTQRGWSYNLFIVSSFDHTLLKSFAKLQPKVRLGILFEDTSSRNWASTKQQNVFSANFDAVHLTAADVQEAHARGLKVNVYTVNTKREARRMRSLKVDGIFTNYPDKVLAV